MSSKPEPKVNEFPEVHSANSWETADLGDEDRNKKFLRLMGAKKKEHHGRFFIGDQDAGHKREKTDEKHMEEELSEQYAQGMEHRLAGGRRGHLGLGYHGDKEEKKDDEENKDDGEKKEEVKKDDDEKEKQSTEQVEGEIKEESDKLEQKNTSEDVGQDKDERKRPSNQEPGDSEAKKIKFVKSSS